MGGFDLNDKPALILTMEQADDSKKAELRAIMTKIGAEFAAAGKKSEDGEPTMIFFTASSNNGPVGRVRELTGASETAEPSLILLDIPDNGGFYVRTDGAALDEASIRDFISQYNAGSLNRKQLGQ